MIVIKFLVENRDFVIEALKKRGTDYTEMIDEIIFT